MNGHDLIEQQEAINRLGGDSELYWKLYQMFLEEIPSIVNKVEEAIQNRNFNALKLHAHYLKGSSTAIGKQIISRISKKLEHTATESKDFEKASLLFEALKNELKRLKIRT